MNIAIVDDDITYQHSLEDMLVRQTARAGMRDIVIVCYSSAEEFLRNWKPYRFQILFLDIYMTGLTGVELARQIRKQDSEAMLIFSTTSNEFASESYEVSASYYLKKPYDEGTIASMLQRLDLSRFMEQQRIYFPDDYYCERSYISYTTYDNHRITITLRDSETHMVRMSQGELKDLLLVHEDFCQINQGIIINLDQVSRMDKSTVQMKDGAILPISRSNQKKTATQFAEFCFRQRRREALL